MFFHEKNVTFKLYKNWIPKLGSFIFKKVFADFHFSILSFNFAFFILYKLFFEKREEFHFEKSF